MQHQQNQKCFQDSLMTNDEHSIFNESQIISVIYDGTTFFVDIISLSNASSRFRKIIQPYVHDQEQLKTLHLEIHGSQFSKRCMNNFLRICQNLPTDVQDSEVKEICEIAKMFQASNIYKTGISFIQSKIDQNFSIPDYKYDTDETVMSIVENLKLNDIKLDDDYVGSECSNKLLNKKYDGKSVTQATSKQIDKESCKNDVKKDPKRKNSVIYIVRAEKNVLKGRTYKFIHNDRILYSAKQKYHEIFICDGDCINIRNQQNHVAHIIQKEENHFNLIKIGDVDFNLFYVDSDIPDHLSIDVSFPANRHVISWFPKPPKYSLDEHKYGLNFQGEYKRIPIRSTKNLVLQNKAGHKTFIVREMGKNLYEFECNHNVDPLIAFTIGLSHVVGPYTDPWSNLNGSFFE